MDFKDSLRPDDLFASYWLDDRLTVLIGDRDDIQAVITTPSGDVKALAEAFLSQVTTAAHYVGFIAEEQRRPEWPSWQEPAATLPAILSGLAARLIPREFVELAASGRYRRLILIPDDVLHGLPLHLLLEAVMSRACNDAFPEGIIYAPSASAYAHARGKRRRERPALAVVLVGDVGDRRIVDEAAKVAWDMPCDTRVVSQRRELETLSGKIDVLYVATHGYAPTPDAAGQRDRQSSGWSLLFDGGSLNVQDFFEERVALARGSVVVLSACNAGQQAPGAAHELQGYVQALFYAGAASVIAARWPIVGDSAEVIFTRTLAPVFEGTMSLGAAFGAAIGTAMKTSELTRLMEGPAAAPFFWGPFVLFGSAE
jgi:hypothetical protein